MVDNPRGVRLVQHRAKLDELGSLPTITCDRCRRLVRGRASLPCSRANKSSSWESVTSRNIVDRDIELNIGKLLINELMSSYLDGYRAVCMVGQSVAIFELWVSERD